MEPNSVALRQNTSVTFTLPLEAASHTLTHTRFVKSHTLCCLLAATGGLRAATLNLDAIPVYVRNHNYSLAAARCKIAEARGRHDQVGRLSNPEIETEFKHARAFDEGALSLTFTQKFPLTARLRLEKSVAAAEVIAAEAEVAEVERQLIAQAQSWAVQLLALANRRALSLQQIENARKLAEFATKGVRAGEISPLDAGQARMEAAQLTLELRQIEADGTKVAGELKPLLGLSAAEPLAIKGSLPSPSIPQTISEPEQKRPDYRAAQLAVQGAEHEIALEKARRYEDVSAGLFLSGERVEDRPDGLKNDAMIGFRFTIPLPLWNKNEGAVQEKLAKRDRAKIEMTALANAIGNEAAATRKELAELAELLSEIETQLLPQAAEQLSRAEATYRNGQTDLLSVLRARDQQIKLESARLNALRDFHLVRIRFEAATGKHTP